MKPEELKALKDVTTLSLPLQALWWDARGEWEKAHEVCQQAKSREGDRVHAYLHRKEGDEGNAGYWYARAGRSRPAEGVSLETEWEELAAELSGERGEGVAGGR
jgi:hypothetical protein